MIKLSMENLSGTASSPSGEVIPFPRLSHARTLITEPALIWRDDVLARLNHVCGLPIGWDGYRASPVSFHTALFALGVLEAICTPATSAPGIVPGAWGDVQIEWHVAAGDIELHIRAPNDVVAWRQTPCTGQDGEELLLTNDFTEVAKWIESLSEPASAAIGAAA